MRHMGTMRRMRRGTGMGRFREGNGGQTKDYQEVKALL
jgi:hypothetical protein